MIEIVRWWRYAGERGKQKKHKKEEAMGNGKELLWEIYDFSQ